MVSDMVKSEEAVKTLSRINCHKVLGLDWIAVKFPKQGGDSVVDQLVRLFDISMA